MKKIFTFTFIIIIAQFVLPHTLFSAEIFIESPARDFKIGDKIYFDVTLDPEGEIVNAVQADIIFPGDILEFFDYYETDSVVTGWVETPKLNGNSVSFAGIIAGGINGVIDPAKNIIIPAKVVRLVFIAKKEGKGSFSFVDAQLFKNDGIATEIELNTSPFEFSVSNESSLVADFSYDKNPPEPFSPFLRRDENFFDGKYFVVFETKDKETGIAYYKIREGSQDWVIAESPYVLQDQSLTSLVRIVAVDKNGNEREARISLNQYPFSIPGLAVLIGLFVLLISVSLFAYVYTKKKY